MASIDRNARCPCGSGRKYKKCCAWKDATDAAAARRSSAPVREATAWKTPEGHFIAEIKPEVDDAVDRLLQRLEQGERQSAKAGITALYQKYSGYHMTNYAIGVYVGLIESNPTKAIPFFREAVRILPTFAQAHYNLGSACFTTCQVGEAVGALREAIRYSSGDDGLDKMAQEKIAELESIVTRNSPFKTIDAFIENQELFNLAFEHLRNKQYWEAAQLFEKVLKQNPKHVQSRGNLALCYASMGRKAAALACLEWALRLDPTYEPARENRKIIEQMTEGKPQLLHLAETEYYRERLNSPTALAPPI